MSLGIKKPTFQKPVKSVSKSYLKGGYFSVWWGLASFVSIYFTVGHGLPQIFRPGCGGLFRIHVINASLVSWLCIFNHAFTPSMGPQTKRAHVFLGKVALVTGIVSTMLGFATVWYERYSGVGIFAIAISLGGSWQVLGQVWAIHHIRNGRVQKHIENNLGAFYGGCLIPAFIRLPELLGVDLGQSWDILAWIIPIVILNLAKRAIVNKSWI
ncbi:hypothetical protein DSO57_1024280 [Entomophthora muscae]|uniref:Uncharacterized protein n=1 Tax=Entomophthora muscae TaxID=34485 RepID=A0ACC2RTK7_9FUNG|nr:hypothetical protein DSO57_1024280 [Entomophthora muscae]